MSEFSEASQERLDTMAVERGLPYKIVFAGGDCDPLYTRTVAEASFILRTEYPLCRADIVDIRKR